MRSSTEDQKLSVCTWLISAVIAGFVVQMVFSRWFFSGADFDRELAASADGIRAGKIWTLLTHGFLHHPDNILHVCSTAIALFFLGRALLPVIGARKFIGVYLAALVCGALAWLTAHANIGGTLYGATSAIDALIVLYACFFPNREQTFLVLFFPVTFKPKYLAYALLVFDGLGFVLYERLGWHSPLAFAHSAHLGGMAVGWIYFRFVHDSDWSMAFGRRSGQLSSGSRTSATQSRVESPKKIIAATQVNYRAEVDRILDKINSKGFAALTPEERQMLAKAKDQLSRR